MGSRRTHRRGHRRAHPASSTRTSGTCSQRCPADRSRRARQRWPSAELRPPEPGPMTRVIETEVECLSRRTSYILDGKVDLLLGGDGSWSSSTSSRTAARPEDAYLAAYSSSFTCTRTSSSSGTASDRPPLLYWTGEARREDALMDSRMIQVCCSRRVALRRGGREDPATGVRGAEAPSRRSARSATSGRTVAAKAPSAFGG